MISNSPVPSFAPHLCDTMRGVAQIALERALREPRSKPVAASSRSPDTEDISYPNPRDPAESWRRVLLRSL
eukprot:4397162-Prorocentrum_lima.AAC.1